MPNWCKNDLFIEGDKADVKRFMDKVAVNDSDGNIIPISFASIISEPENISDSLEWRIKHWGTKWDIDYNLWKDCDYGEGWVSYSFDTAWEPPLSFVDNAAKMFDSLFFTIEYYEPCWGFSGVAKWINGMFVGDERKGNID